MPIIEVWFVLYSWFCINDCLVVRCLIKDDFIKNFQSIFWFRYVLQLSSEVENLLSIRYVKHHLIRVKRLDSEIAKITDSIVNLTTEQVLGNVEKGDIKGVLQKLQERRSALENDKDEVLKTIDTEKSHRIWVDWVKEFGKRVVELKNPDMTTDEKKRFLQGVIDEIQVLSVDKQQHQIDIKFHFPCVDDKLFRDDEGKFHPVDGSFTKMVKGNLLKKSTG